MCVGIPGKIIKITNTKDNLAMVDVSGVKREVNIACIVDADHSAKSCVGDWALIHVGFAMARMDEKEAAKTLKLLHELGEVQLEMDAMLS